MPKPTKETTALVAAAVRAVIPPSDGWSWRLTPDARGLTLTVAVMAWHSVLGVQVVIEDYVHGAAVKTVALFLNQFVHWLSAALAVYAVLHIAFRGA